MKNKKIISSIMYGIMLSVAHITFAMDEADKNSVPIIFYSKLNNGKFTPLNNIPNAPTITPEKGYVIPQGYLRTLENNNLEAFRHNANENGLIYKNFSQKDLSEIERTINEGQEFYIQPSSNQKVFLRFNKESINSIKKPLPEGEVKAIIYNDIYADAESILRQQKEDQQHLIDQQKKRQSNLEQSQQQLSESSSSEEEKQDKKRVPIRMPKIPTANLIASTPDHIVTTPEPLRTNSRNQSPTASSPGTPDAYSSSNDSSYDSSSSNVSQQTSSAEELSLDNLRQSLSGEDVSNALKNLAYKRSPQNPDSYTDDIVFDTTPTISEFPADSNCVPTASKAPLTTLEKLAAAEQMITEHEEEIKTILTPKVGPLGAELLAEGTEAALDITQKILSTETADQTDTKANADIILTGRAMDKTIETIPYYNIVTISYENDSYAITFIDPQGPITKKICIALLNTNFDHSQLPPYIIVENEDGYPDYGLYVTAAPQPDPQVAPKENPQSAPYYKQYPGRVLAGSMSVLAAFIVVAYHYDHLPEGMMNMLNELTQALSKNLPFSRSA